MNILICGGNGFIGKNLINKFYLKTEVNIRATYFNDIPNEIGNIEWVQADLRKLEDVKRVLKDIDIVFQYAATTTGAKDILSRPYIHVTDNVVMNSILIREAFENNVKHFIFPSCTIMYKHSSKPQQEDDFDESRGIYDKYYGAGNTKVYLEKMCKFFSQFGKTKFTVLRQSNIYGPFDKYNLETSHVFGATITKVMSDMENITVWGKGQECRDFLHVNDLVNLLESIILKQNSQFELVNACYGQSISISDLVETAIKVSKTKKRINYDTSKPTLPIDILVDNNKSKELFNWSPSISIESGLKDTIAWYLANVSKR